MSNDYVTGPRELITLDVTGYPPAHARQLILQAITEARPRCNSLRRRHPTLPAGQRMPMSRP